MPRAAVSRGGFLAGRSRRRVQADCRYLKAQSGSESPNNATAPCLVSVPLGVIGNTPDSGSGESWFEPRRGNSKRDATMSRVALRHFSLCVIVSVYVVSGREATLRSGRCRFLLGSPEKGSGEFCPSSL